MTDVYSILQKNSNRIWWLPAPVDNCIPTQNMPDLSDTVAEDSAGSFHWDIVKLRHAQTVAFTRGNLLRKSYWKQQKSSNRKRYCWDSSDKCILGPGRRRQSLHTEPEDSGDWTPRDKFQLKHITQASLSLGAVQQLRNHKGFNIVHGSTKPSVWSLAFTACVS